MKTLATFLLVMLGFLAGCTSAGEKQALYEVYEFYGGGVRFSSGRNFSARGNEPQGHYLAILLNSRGLSRRYPDLRLPASNCAYLAFNNLKPHERDSYDFVRVTLQDSVGTHAYLFSQQQLKQAVAAAEDLRTLIFNIQASDYVAAANNFNVDAIGAMPRDSLPNIMYRIGERINPFTEYRIQGFALKQVPVRGKPLQLVRLNVSVPLAPEPDHNLVVAIDPALSDTQHFLYGFYLTN